VKAEKLNYEPSLDGIRAFAVLGVVLAHGLPGPYYIPGGGIGVDVFFVLSGFLITRIIAAEIDASGSIDLKHFYLRRFLRLTPALALLLFAELTFELLTSSNAADHVRAALISGTYLMNWNRAFQWWPRGHLGHTWSLAMEEQFYLIWPALLIVIFHRRPIIWLALIIAFVLTWRSYLVLHGASVERIYNGFDTHSDSLFIGCALGLMPPIKSIRRYCLLWSPLPLAALIFVLMFYNLNAWYETAASAATAWIIIAALHDGWMKRFLSHPVLVYTGKISYEWYLWHYPVLMAGTNYFGDEPGVALTFGFLAYPVAALSHHFVGLPFLHLKARY
jgi:peptidoglycan/LPS O-acetylase OafA/YrhL